MMVLLYMEAMLVLYDRMDGLSISASVIIYFVFVSFISFSFLLLFGGWLDTYPIDVMHFGEAFLTQV
ncbi:hypothetical protein Leryth_003631 [Lithospermum erythrorhizon]|nr:hypothetical protein Leryth_003631 [Lithospermum erythrorhizon]